jgi:hypothetical protein
MNNTCFKCHQEVTLASQDFETWVDATDGDACPEGGVHGIRKQMEVYDHRRADSYERSHPTQHDTTTATVWVVHMQVEEPLLNTVLERMAVSPNTTGEYGFGDSWTEWGEAPHGPTDLHLAVYFRAKPHTAYATAMHLWSAASIAAGRANGALLARLKGTTTTPGVGNDFAVSTSGDFAEQIKEV